MGVYAGEKDILHFSIQSVVFSNFEKKEKNADRIAPECITEDCEVKTFGEELERHPEYMACKTLFFFLFRTSFFVLLFSSLVVYFLNLS